MNDIARGGTVLSVYFFVGRTTNVKKNLSHKVTSVENIPEALPLEYLTTSRNRRSWPFTLDIRRYSDGFTGDGLACDCHQVIMSLEPQLIYTRSPGYEQQAEVRTNEIGILPADLETYFDGSPGSSMGIFFRPILLDQAYEHVTGRPRANVGLPHILNKPDQTLSKLCEILKDEVSQPEHPAQLLFVEAVFSSLLLHLVKEFAIQKLPTGVDYGLGPRLLGAVLDYIHDHPGELLSLSELADIAGVSRFHFSRLFKDSMGTSPMRYVERCRLDTARRMIICGHETLSQIAVATGFADQSHFCRRFKFHFGFTPAQFASIHAPNIVRMRSRDS